MLSALAIILGTAWGIVVVHEHGHRFAARLLGVPADAVRVVYGMPSHTALRCGDSWLAPDDDGYVAAFRAHRAGARAGWTFVAAGFVIETAVALAVCCALVLLGAMWPALLVAAVSGVVFLGYVLADAVASLARRRPHGDASVMWSLLPWATVAALLLVASAKGAALVLALPTVGSA